MQLGCSRQPAWCAAFYSAHTTSILGKCLSESRYAVRKRRALHCKGLCLECRDKPQGSYLFGSCLFGFQVLGQLHPARFPSGDFPGELFYLTHIHESDHSQKRISPHLPGVTQFFTEERQPAFRLGPPLFLTIADPLSRESLTSHCPGADF